MTLKEQLNESMKQAMRARDELRLSTVRMVRSMVQNREIDKKQRRESIRLYEEGNRQDLADKEKAELEILLGFLPAQLDAAEIGELVARAIAEAGVTSIKDMGKVMKIVAPLTAGRADGKVVSDIVKEQLS
jgi:uncharacterized protein YqeY